MPKVMGGDREHEAAMAQERPRGAAPPPRSGAAAERSYPVSEVRGGGQEELPHAQGQGQQPGGATPQGAVQAQEGERSYSMFKVRRGGCEEIPLIQGKEQRVRFAGAAVKRYPTSKVKRNPIRW